ncbi:MAG: Transrane protein [Gemmatimonadales bacterium]|nr:Transrane protein [Gemmatimonadales bacterium]
MLGLGRHRWSALAWSLLAVIAFTITPALIGSAQARAAQAPVIASPTDGSTVGTAWPNFQGSASPGATVTVRPTAGSTICTARAGSDGAWSCWPQNALDWGTTTVVAQDTDALGHVLGTSTPVTFTTSWDPLDLTVITSPTDGAALSDPRPIFRGTGEPGDEIILYVDGQIICDTQVKNADHIWSCRPDEELRYTTLTVTALDGWNMVTSAPVTLTLNVPAAAPIITSPHDKTVTRQARPQVTGTGSPDATVRVATTTGKALCTTMVDTASHWTCKPDADLTGTAKVVATQTNWWGNLSPLSRPISITIDRTAPSAPLITSPKSGSKTRIKTPIVSGTGEVGATVRVTTSSGKTLCTATVAGNRHWSCKARSLKLGRWTIKAVQSDQAGNVSKASRPVTFTVQR